MGRPGSAYYRLCGNSFDPPRENFPIQNIPTQTRVSSVEITPTQAYAKYQQGVFFWTFAPQAEWNQFHLSRSTLIPLDQLQSRWRIAKDKDIVVIAYRVPRSEWGCHFTAGRLTRVAYMSGGLQAWIAAGYPVQSGTP